MTNLYDQFKSALRDRPAPSLVLDLDAFESNIRWTLKNAGTKKIRIATKSVRSVEVLRRILASSDVFQGLMTYTLEEALWLRGLGFKDILMGYPTTDKKALSDLAKDPQGITLMVDLPEHLDLLESFDLSGKFSVCLDVDLSMDLPGTRFGVYRSAIGSAGGLDRVLERLKGCQKVHVTGLMGYEAQIAGVGDKHSLLMRVLKHFSIKQLRKRREETFQKIMAAGHKLTLINGGGTGSLSSTREESCVTELTVGSGFYAPALFDHYRDFNLTPALSFTLPVIRRPAPDIITCLGGGYIASGGIEFGKQPVPYLPPGLQMLKHEGAGEVQTPFKLSAEHHLAIGDFVVMRHAKAGEPCERFNHITMIQAGRLVGLVETYRGAGKCFL